MGTDDRIELIYEERMGGLSAFDHQLDRLGVAHPARGRSFEKEEVELDTLLVR